MNQRALKGIVRTYASCPAEFLWDRLRADVAARPGCPVARFLLGCQCFDRGRSAAAVRHMMVAHHGEPQFESAALLVFAGLKWVSARGARLLPVLLETWEEFRRPDFDRRPAERLLLDAFTEPEEGLRLVSPLARGLWRLPIKTLRGQIREAVLTPGVELHSLLTVPV
jgi:hypothetical protein